MTSADAWSYISSEDNPADVGTREDCVKRLNCSFLWLHGPEFLLRENLQLCHSPVMVRRLRASEGLLVEQCTGLDLLNNAAPSLYVLKKRVAYLSLFKLWIIAKYKRIVRLFCTRRDTFRLLNKVSSVVLKTSNPSSKSINIQCILPSTFKGYFYIKLKFLAPNNDIQ